MHFYPCRIRNYSEQQKHEANETDTPKKVDPTEKIKQWSEIARINGQARFAAWTNAAEQQFTLLGSKLNQLTGYGIVEELKRQVVEQGMPDTRDLILLIHIFFQETRIDAARTASRQAKAAYENAVTERSKCQREVNDLLQRKSSWSDSDVVRFTNLVRQDHLNEQAEAKAKVEASQSDQAIEQEFQSLTRAILNRYHEEQVWSDKIRSASTYGSLVALGLNLAVFVLAVIVVEPYKRKKMAQTFENRIETLSLETREMVEKIASRVDEHLVRQETLLAPLAAVNDRSESTNLKEGLSTSNHSASMSIDNREIMSAGLGAAAAIVFCGALFLSLNR